MRNALSALGALAVLSLFGCGKPAEPKPLPAPPSIKSFAADKARITAGDSVTLSFAAENATSAELVDQTGNKIELSGTATAGSAQVAPAQTSFYVLRVAGEGGRASAFVQVAVDEDLREVTLLAVPPTIDSGQSAQLLWSAAHATSATINVGSGATIELDAAAGSGVVDVTPARSETYELSARGAFASATASASASVAVRPVLTSAEMVPAAANVGEDLGFTWTTGGAAEVTISERTFGELFKSATADEVNAGNFTWTVPSTLPNSTPVQAGFPLEFTLAVKQANPDVTRTQVFYSFVGDGPKITTFLAPVAVTSGKRFDLSWTTINATRLQVFADGKLIYEPLSRDTAKVTAGSITLTAPQADSTFQVVAYGFGGSSVKQSRLLKVVPVPVISSFSLPASVAAAGDPATATWKTQNATAVTLRVKNGLTVYSTTDAATIASGTAALRPGVKTTFELEAWNDAGDVVRQSKVVDVTSPATFTASPRLTTPGSPVTLSWDMDPATTAQVFGDLKQIPVRNNPATEPFEDLSIHADAKELSFANQDDGVAQVPVTAGFRFPMGGLVASQFWVSTNGFVSFENVGARPANTSLDATSTIPAMVAPFWDDLMLGDHGKIYYLLEGTSFPRRLIIQWNDVETKVDGSSALTFQVQLHETGEVRFSYSTLSGTDSAAENASVGWRLDATLNDELANTKAPSFASGDEAVLFASGALTGQFTVNPKQATVYGLVTRLASGPFLVLPASVNVVDPSWLALDEAMVVPDLSATAGQWVELANRSANDVDLSGAMLTTAATPTSFALPEGTILPANGFLVFGQSVDPMQNGEAHVDLAWGSLAPDLVLDDTLSLTLADGTSLTSLAWTASAIQPGVAVQAPDLSVITSAGTTPTCAPTSTFGSNGAVGTPGSPNDSCYPYQLRAIPVNYADISPTGTALFTPGSSNMDIVTAALDLSAAPFTYFGASKSTMTVSSNGFLVFGTTSATDSNDTKPDTSPAGAVAPFWDDLNNVAGGSGNVFAERFEANQNAADGRPHWVIQWHHFTHFASGDDLNFQIKLFDDGSIEFHYATMQSGSTSNYANGNSATVWIADPAGTRAQLVGINKPVIQSNTAYRFSPKP